MANENVQKLYDDLMALCEKDDNTFFYVDSNTPVGEKVRIFSYHYAKYSDWLLDSAIESRGIMFSLTDDDKVNDILARPMQKFFNYQENPLTTDLDFENNSVFATDKEDGSLISSYMSQGFLYMKSKASLYSDQAVAAMQLINSPGYEGLRAFSQESFEKRYTCNFEYVSPTNRIVIQYQEPTLRLLNVRNIDTGEYVPYEDLYSNASIRQYLVEGFQVKQDAVEEWIESVTETTGIEGYVCQMSNGTWFKLKTDWYVGLHSTKNYVTNNKNLYSVVISGASDDLKALFAGDDYAVNKIQAFEDTYLTFITTAVDIIKDTWKQVNGRERKEFAINSKQILDQTNYPWLFSIVMSYFGSQINYETIVDKLGELFIKNVDQFIPSAYSKELAELPDEEDE